MNKSKSAVFLSITVAVFFAYSAAALAEFKGGSKATSGKSERIYAKIEAGGATITCGEPETKGAPEWTIEKEGKAAEKGPSLHLKVKTWGSCGTEVGGETRSVTGSECELEAKQTKEEGTVGITVLSACAFKFETKKPESCEIKITSAENSERSHAALADAGEHAESLGMELALTGVTTTVSGSCEASGIKPTHTGKLTGLVESLQVTPQRPNPLWEFRFAPNVVRQIVGLNNSTELRLVNRQAVASNGPGNLFTATIETDAGNNPFFTITTRTVPECRTFMYSANGGANDRCTMKVKYVLGSGAMIRFTVFRVVSAGNELEALFYIAASER
jgi:hypothetical protein